MNRMIKLLGTGKYLPNKKISAEELAEKIGVTKEWIMKKSGVETRYFVESETTAFMGAQAGLQAIQNAGLSLKEIDAVVSAGGVMQQSIPCTAALIQQELGLEGSGIPAFDINSTCLGFVTALDLLSSMITCGRYKNILLVCSDIASTGLNWEHLESCTLFGDGAAAVVIGPTPKDESSKVYSAHIETYCEGVNYCRIQGGGSALHPRNHGLGVDKRFLFEMNGMEIFRMASKTILPFMNKLLKTLHLDDIDLVIPHQASVMAIRIIQKKLGLENDQIVNIARHCGNVIAASLPMALHEAIQNHRLKRGDKCVLLGTSAGFSIGGIILEY
ncbi:MAG: 3-oxoacyl-ACP synthase [Parachlamydia sp.]|nr:MAG: 3-oxoacyl-ACP synthase [Parachlamydia sp.]